VGGGVGLGGNKPLKTNTLSGGTIVVCKGRNVGKKKRQQIALGTRGKRYYMEKHSWDGRNLGKKKKENSQ